MKIIPDHYLIQQLQRRLGVPSLQLHVISGGNISNAYKIITTSNTFFCKINSATKFPHLFQKEAAGLSFLQKQGIFKIPKPIECFTIDTYQVLLLEWIENTTPEAALWNTLGEQLALLHQITQKSFGWEQDNYMGAVEQTNHLTDNWSEFFVLQRLQPLVTYCYSNQLLSSKQVAMFERVYQKVNTVFENSPPALLHGDLWSGNLMCTALQEPVLIDPAVYFGHRSMDLGMTSLFGGFKPAFYESYHYHSPLPPNHKEQWKLTNLYPLLIHLRLFGKSYLPSIVRTLNDFQ